MEQNRKHNVTPRGPFNVRCTVHLNIILHFGSFIFQKEKVKSMNFFCSRIRKKIDVYGYENELEESIDIWQASPLLQSAQCIRSNEKKKILKEKPKEM